jgi:hypothetical protein
VKPVLAWIKSNPVIVVLSALILLMLPSAWFVSSWWSNKIRSAQEQSAKRDWDKLKGTTIDYVVPSYEPNVAAVSFKDVPNKALIKWFKEQRETLKAKADELVVKAEQFNKGVGPDAQTVGRSEHKPLVDGLFPPPASRDDELLKLNEMEDSLLGLKGKPNPYQQMLDGARAGGPAEAARVAEVIQDMKARETEKVTAGKRDLTAEEQTELYKKLADRRLAEYQSRVTSLSFYATLESLPHDTRGSFVPTGSHIDPALIEPMRLYIFQWDLWTLQDLVSAVKFANTGPDGKQKNVDQAIVKRIVSIEMDAPEGVESGEDVRGAGRDIPGSANAAPAAGPAGMVPLDLNISVTGRGMGAFNPVYDIRRAKMTVVVASAHLQEFLEAIARTNFMTVTDLDLQEVNPWDDLKKGYFYGPDHVVKATIGIESVWLRSWTSGYMPPKLKAALKIPEPPPADPNAPAPVKGQG